MSTLLLRLLLILSLSPMAVLHPGWWQGELSDGDVFQVGPRHPSLCNADGDHCSEDSSDQVDVPDDAMLAGTLVIVGGFVCFVGAALFGIIGHTRAIQRVPRRWLDVVQLANAITLATMVYFLARLASAMDGAPTAVGIGALGGTVAIMAILQLGVRRSLTTSR